uniref:C3H1-type domain-containing protein n=1 Tax=Haptolina ericina TaxID=156174 RepID=A0A7S3B634_9EUKA
MAQAHREASIDPEGDQNPNTAPGETRICYDFLNLGRCGRARICSFRHLLPESAAARADADRRGVQVHRAVAQDVALQAVGPTTGADCLASANVHSATPSASQG